MENVSVRTEGEEDPILPQDHQAHQEARYSDGTNHLCPALDPQSPRYQARCVTMGGITSTAGISTITVSIVGGLAAAIYGSDWWPVIMAVGGGGGIITTMLGVVCCVGGIFRY